MSDSEHNGRAYPGTTEHYGRLYPHVTTTSGMRGCFAVLVSWNSDGFAEPWNTGMGSYASPEAAAVEGRQWAEAEELPFYP